MSAWLVAACGLAYLWVSGEQALKGQWSLACMYFGYFVANIGATVIAWKGVA
jgi:hypothetical protein